MGIAAGLAGNEVILVGIGGVFSIVSLVLLLGYLNLLGAINQDHRRFRILLMALILPLLVVFVAIVIHRTLLILG